MFLVMSVCHSVCPWRRLMWLVPVMPLVITYHTQDVFKFGDPLWPLPCPHRDCPPTLVLHKDLYKLVQYVALQAGSWHLTKGPSCCARGFLCDNKHIQVTKLLPVGFEVTIHGLWIQCFPYPNTSHAHFTNVIYFVSKWNGFIRFNVNCYTFEAHRLRQLHFFAKADGFYGNKEICVVTSTVT